MPKLTSYSRITTYLRTFQKCSGGFHSSAPRNICAALAAYRLVLVGHRVQGAGVGATAAERPAHCWRLPRSTSWRCAGARRRCSRAHVRSRARPACG
eukprot:765353-Prymnesium_polylepis.1